MTKREILFLILTILIAIVSAVCFLQIFGVIDIPFLPEITVETIDNTAEILEFRSEYETAISELKLIMQRFIEIVEVAE